MIDPSLLGRAASELDTPALLVDLDRLDANLDRMQETARKAGVVYRPHVKTHKAPFVAHRQLVAGACGVACAKLAEAEAMVQGGVPDILITTPIVGATKIRRLAALARHARLAVVVDDADNVAELSDAASAAGVRIDALVEVDVGQGRCGVPSGGAAADLAVRIARSEGLRFRGLQGYNGSLQLVAGYDDRRAAVRASLDRLLESADRVRSAGVEIEVLTGGGTGSAAIDVAFGGLTELQPGSYVFMDSSYAAIEWDEAGAPPPFRPALTVLASVISRPSADRRVIDVGWKSISADAGPPVPLGLPGVRCEFAGDEHGILRGSGDALPLAPGDKVELLPAHCDTTVNLYDRCIGVRGGIVEIVWSVTGRGCSQ